jgi:hypothetical protein
VTEEGKDQGLHRSVFEDADASPAGLEIASLSVEGQTEIWVVSAPDHGVKVKGGTGFL